MNWFISTIFMLVLDSKFHNALCKHKNYENDYIRPEKLKELKEKSNEMTLINNMEHCTANRTNQVRHWPNYYYNFSSQKTKKAEFEIANIIVRVYVGSVARLPCHLYISSIEETQVVWMYAASMKNLSFSVIEEKETVVINGDLTLYYTRPEDEGVYRCQVGKRYGGLTLLEVTDEEKYTVVKPSSSHGPYLSPPAALNESLMIFTYWSQWSECSKCGRVGRRRRYGICYVALIDYEISNKTAKHNNYTSSELVSDEVFKLFHVYPKGIPCRSQSLPPFLRSLPEIQTRYNEIMIGLCKVRCKEGIFEMRSDSGQVLERANNTAGVYSLCQNKPLQPPPIARETMFVLPGAKVLIRCPGTILRDTPVTWRIGDEPATPRRLDAATSGRVHLNARDHIVINHVDYADANVYSCWQDNILAGVVKLETLNSAEKTYRNRLTLVAVIILLILLLRLTKHILHYRLRKFCAN